MPVAYRNTAVDVVNPVTVCDHTAVAILTFLQRAGGWVRHDALDAAIVSYPQARLYCKPLAIKGLRNRRYAITATKARHNSGLTLVGTPDENDDERQRVVEESYSEAVTQVRKFENLLLLFPNDPQTATSYNAARMFAYAVGQQLGMTIIEVDAEIALVS